MPKTPAIYDFDAIGQGIRAEDDQPSSATTTLSDLIAEEKRAWNAHTRLNREADLLYFAWRKANPALDKEIEDTKDLPAPMGELYREGDALEETATALSERIVAWVPNTVSEAVALLEWKAAADDPEVDANVLTGLRTIAVTTGGETRGQLPEARAVRLFQQWISAELRANEIGKTAPDDDPEFDAACDRANSLYDRICAEPATDLPNLAVKVYLRLYDEYPGGNSSLTVPETVSASKIELALAREAARLLPELLGPRCADFIAAAEVA